MNKCDLRVRLLEQETHPPLADATLAYTAVLVEANMSSSARTGSSGRNKSGTVHVDVRPLRAPQQRAPLRKAVDTRVEVVIEQLARPQSLTLVEIAKSVNLSTSRLRHLFKEHLGLSPGRYAKFSRLEQAQRLLEGSFLSIKEVMAAVGFADASHFSKDYRLQYGHSPSQARAHRGLKQAES